MRCNKPGRHNPAEISGPKRVSSLRKEPYMKIEHLGVEARMSKIVLRSGAVFLCGQVTKDYSAEIKEQTKTMLENVDSLLAEAGSDRDHIVSTTIYLRDMKDYGTVNEVRDAWLSKKVMPRHEHVSRHV